MSPFLIFAVLDVRCRQYLVYKLNFFYTNSIMNDWTLKWEGWNGRTHHWQLGMVVAFLCTWKMVSARFTVLMNDLCPWDTVSGLLRSSSVVCRAWYCVKTPEPIVNFLHHVVAPPLGIYHAEDRSEKSTGFRLGALNRGGLGEKCVLANLSRYISEGRDTAIVATEHE